MRRTLLPTLSILLVASFWCGPSSAQDLTELARHAKQSVVTLKVKNRFGRGLGQGSGFFVDPAGLIVTNYHVVENGSRIEAVLSRESQTLSLEAYGVVGYDEVNDLAVVKVAPGPFPALALADFGGVEPGQRVVVLGNPQGFGWTLSEGIVSAVRTGSDIPEFYETPVLQITAAVSPGSSGSPVMNLQGEVVGVAATIFTGGQNLNFAIPSTAVRELLASIDPNAEPLRPGAKLVKAGTLAYLRNVGISLVFFAAVYYGFRRLR